MSSMPKREIDRALWFGISRGLVIVITLLLVAVAVGISTWAFGVFTADVKGAGEAIKQQRSGLTRVQKQEMFEQLAADFEGYVVKIGNAKEAVAIAQAAGSKTTLELRETELIGLKQICVDAAQQFNAESRKYTARVWKSAGLPERLDPTLCK